MARKPTASPADPGSRQPVRPPAELLYADELAALAAVDKDPRPAGWRLSPRSIRSFICGCDKPMIERKFVGDDALVERAIISLASTRGLMLVGEPGTAKSMLSELLAAAVCGQSTNTIQGSAGTTDDQIKYSWNYALLLAEGASTRALVPAPLFVAMRDGVIVRFEEITRCPPEVQDTLVSVLSDKVLMIPELSGDDRMLFAAPGFNVIGTANTRDRGVHEMSSALKRRFNFETVPAIRDLKAEAALVSRECEKLLAQSGAKVDCPPDVIALLVTAFHDLREGKTADGAPVERTSAVMSTAEAVAVAYSAGLDAYYYGNRTLTPQTVVRHLPTAALKDAPEDVKKLMDYFDGVVRKRAKDEGGLWEAFYKARTSLR